MDKMNGFALTESCCDYLTEMVNRRGLYEYYNTLGKDVRIHAMFIDVDNFKRVNDSYGHSVGDQLLVALSKLIYEHTKAFTARIGGDEFVVLFDHTMEEDSIIEIAETMLEQLPELAFRKDILSLISLSIGIVFDQSASQTLDCILAKCDDAMYQAKYDGKNRYTIYKSYEETHILNKNIELEMEEALANGEFVVYLQPKMNMVTTSLYGAEALSRWKHPKDGVRTPAVYIPLFEKTGFISQLDMYIFEQTCKIKAGWRKEKYANLPVSVNMSRLHLYDRVFPEKLEEIANHYGIPTNELEIEITESTFIKDSTELIAMVKRLRDKGFLVSIDDFGSGFSALNLLKDLPVDTIKIDREFLQISSNDARGKKVIRNVIQMCRDLKMDVVTEGVENRDQAEFIVSCGCTCAQGYYYAKPLTEEQFREFAEEYMPTEKPYCRFSFSKNLRCEDGSMKAVMNGNISYETGIFENSYALSFPGGDVGENTVSIPTAAVLSDSYTISMWLRPKELHLWTAALYMKFESGFLGMIPEAWEGHSSCRIRDSKEVYGWYDVSGMRIRDNEWSQYAVTYNAKTEIAMTFINGEVVGKLENIPTNRYVKQILLGGDVFQPSFCGEITELVFYNEPKDYDFMKELHLSYISRPDFIGFPIDADSE